MRKLERESSPVERWPTSPNHSTTKNCFLRFTRLSNWTQNETISRAGAHGRNRLSLSLLHRNMVVDLGYACGKYGKLQLWHSTNRSQRRYPVHFSTGLGTKAS